MTLKEAAKGYSHVISENLVLGPQLAALEAEKCHFYSLQSCPAEKSVSIDRGETKMAA